MPARTWSAAVALVEISMKSATGKSPDRCWTAWFVAQRFDLCRRRFKDSGVVEEPVNVNAMPRRELPELRLGPMRNDTDGPGGTRRLECEEVIGQRRPRVDA